MKPTSPPRFNDVEIELPATIPTDAEAEVDFAALTGTQVVGKETAKKLRALGIHVKGQGILQTQRGALYVNQVWLLGVGQELYRLLMERMKKKGDKEVDTDDVCKLAEHLIKLAGKQAELSAAMISTEPPPPERPAPQQATTPSFPAGTVVIAGNAQAYIRQGTHEPPPEKTIAKPPVEV